MSRYENQLHIRRSANALEIAKPSNEEEIEAARQWLATHPMTREERIKLFVDAMSTPDYLIAEDLR